jgi:transcriptional regulator with XRE-family HTH domain
VVDPVGSPTLVRRTLGRRLKTMREQAGKSIEDVLAAGVASRSKIYRLENGKGVIKQGDVLTLARLYGVDLTSIDDLLMLADATRTTGPKEGYGSLASDQGWVYADLEAGAAVLRDYSPELVHGLLQTEAYARAVTQVNPSLSPEVVERRVALRMRRQRSFFERPKPGRLEVAISAGAMDLVVGSPAVAQEQIAHLRVIAAQGKADVRVLVPTNGVHIAMRGPFTLMDFDDPDDPPLVYLESYIGSRYVERKDHVAAFRAAFDAIRTQAVPVEEYLEPMATRPLD